MSWFAGAKMTPGQNQASKNVNRLTLAFMKAMAVRQADKNDNLIVSPYNLLKTLAVAAQGSDGAARRDFSKVLFSCGSGDLASKLSDFASLSKAVVSTGHQYGQLAQANAFWVNADRARTSFNQVAKVSQDLGTEARGTSFSAFDAATTANNFISNGTGQAITALAQPLSSRDVLRMVSASYFKGNWTRQFDPRDTQYRIYTTDDGCDHITPTMSKFFHREGEIRYLKGVDYEALAMTYGANDFIYGHEPPLRLVLIKPSDARLSARDWFMKQTEKTVAGCLDPSSYTNASGSVALPRMEIQQNHDLQVTLKDVGLGPALSVTADYTRMMRHVQPAATQLGTLTQDIAFIADEGGGGDRLSAGVAMMAAVAQKSSGQRISLAFDRSFVFALQDTASGAVIMAGIVNRPSPDMQFVPAL